MLYLNTYCPWTSVIHLGRLTQSYRMTVNSMRYLFGQGMSFSGSKLSRKQQLDNVVCNCVWYFAVYFSSLSFNGEMAMKAWILIGYRVCTLAANPPPGRSCKNCCSCLLTFIIRTWKTFAHELTNWDAKANLNGKANVEVYSNPF